MLTALAGGEARRGARSSRSTRCPRPGLIRFQHPQHPLACSAAARRSPTCSCRSASTATWRCSRASAKAMLEAGGAAAGGRSTASSSPSTPTASRPARRTLRAAAWDEIVEAERHRPRADRARRRELVVDERAASSSAGRWGSRSTRTPSQRSRRSSTSLLLRGSIGKPGRRGLPGARPQQRAGRPHDGHLGAADGARSSTRSSRRVRLRRRRAQHGSTRWRRSGPCTTAGPRCSSRMGGNFLSATPDTEYTAAALRTTPADRRTSPPS